MRDRIDTLNEQLSNLISKGQKHIAERLLFRSIDEGLKPDVRSFNLILKAYITYSPPKVLSLFKRIKEYNLEPDIASYTMLICANLRLNQIDTALSVFHHVLQKRKVDAVMYESIIQHLVDANRVDLAYKIFDEMISDGFIQPNVKMITSLIIGFSQRKDVKTILELLSLLEKFNLKKDLFLYNVIIEAFCNVNDIEGAKCILNEMKKNCVLPSVDTYSCFIRYLLQRDELEEALHFFEEMKNANIEADLNTYRNIIQYCITNKRWDLVKQYIIEIEKKNFKGDVILKLDVKDWIELLKSHS